MKTRTVILLSLLLAVTSTDGGPRQTVLYVDQQKTVYVKGASQISIAGKGRIASGMLSSNGRYIVLTGKKPGTVSMTVDFRDGHKEERTIKVLPRERQQVILEFSKLSMLFNDIQIINVGDNIGLVGKIYSVRESRYLSAFLERYPEIINLMEDVRGEVLLQMDVQIVEVNLTGAQDLGINWFAQSKGKVAFPNGMDYGELHTAEGSIQLGEEYVPRRVLPDPQLAVGPLARLSPFTVKINFLVNKGKAKVLARPKLVCKSGEKASFLVGGEFPIRSATPEKMQIEWKRYGTNLEIEPVLVQMGANEVDVKIRIGISNVDWANQVEGFPAVSQRIASTRVKVAEGSAVAIAGLLSERKSRVQSRLPFLGAIPFLGRLFSSTKDQNEQMETVIIITPRILPVKSDQLNMQPESKEIRKELKP